MADLLLFTVASSGGDYTSLEAALDDNEQPLVTNDKYLEVDIDDSFEDTAEVTAENYTTDATRDITCEVTSGNHHVGVWDEAKYHLAMDPANFANGFEIAVNYFSLIGIQLTHDSGNNGIAFYTGSSTNVFVNRCILRQTGGLNVSGINSETAGTGSGIIRNTLVYDFDYDGINTQGANQSWQAQNCTVVNCGEDSYQTGYSDTIYVNCAAYDSTDAWQGTADSSSEYNAYDEGSDPGSNGVDISGEAGTDLFADYNNDDFRVKDVDSALYDAGVDMSGTYTDDIAGNTRSQWDIGCHEYQAGGATVEASITEGVELSDSPAVIASLAASVTEGLTLGDSRSPIAQLLAEISDGAVFADESARQVTYRAELTDGTAFGDTIDVRADLLAELTDGTTFGDTIDVRADLLAELADGAAFGDSPAVRAQLLVALSDGAVFSDLSSAGAALIAAAISEGIALGDSASAAASLLAALTDGVVLSDSAGGERTITAITADGISLSDGTTVTAKLLATTEEGIHLSDAPAVLAKLLAAVSEGIELADVASAAGDVAVGLLSVTVSSRTYSVTITARVPGAEVSTKTPGAEVTTREG